MPRITVGLFSGRAITGDVANIIKVQLKDFIVVLQDATHGNWYASEIRH